MSQPTVNSRPATWSGTSAPILYKFTSTNYANAGYRMEVEIWDATAAAKIADAVYYANSSGAVTVDVSAFLRSNMSLDNTADLTTADVIYSDTNWIKYYIKYQEVWTASSESQVNDNDNPRWAIYGGLQIGSANDFTDYVTPIAVFPMLSNEGTVISGYPFLISAYDKISDLIIQKYKNGSLSSTDTETMPDNDEYVILKLQEDYSDYDKLIISMTGVLVPVSNSTFQGSGSTITDWDETTATVQDWRNPHISPSFGSQPYCGTSHTFAAMAEVISQDGFDFQSGVEYTITLNYKYERSNPANTVGFDCNIDLFDGSNTYTDTDSVALPGNGNITDRQFVSVITPSTDCDTIKIRFTTPSATSGYQFYLVSISIVDDQPSTETKTINILPDCQNTVMLQWRNSLGGVECYPFIFNQEYTFDYGNGKKAKRLTLYAENLTLSQWEAIQGLNTTGDRYRTPITELTTSLNRTSAQIGQSVYVLNSDGSKTGVVVIPQANTTFTKQKKHQARVTIEYPEIFLQ